MTSLDFLPVRYAVAAIRQLNESDVFCGLRPIESGEEVVLAPFVLAMDEITEAALVYQVGVHMHTPNHKSDRVALVGVIVGEGHPALLLAVESNGSLRDVREVDTTVLCVEVAGSEYKPTDGEPTYVDVLFYDPQQAAPHQRRPWWRFWGRG